MATSAIGCRPCSPSAGACLSAQQAVDWPVYGGSDDHTHYTTLEPDHAGQRQAAQGRVDVRRRTTQFTGSEMQTNPIVIDGVLYGTSPKLRVFALDAATGQGALELRSAERRAANVAHPPSRRRRHRRSRALQLSQPALRARQEDRAARFATFGDSGWVDLRAGLGRPVQGLSVSASTPGVVFEDLLIMGSTVPEALPSAPGDIRAYDVKTGALRWSFHTIPHPGEPGYETWPPDAWKITGGVERLVRRHGRRDARAMVFVATGSASYDFYGGNRVGDDLYANSVIALDARTGKRIWHYQVRAPRSLGSRSPRGAGARHRDA